MKLEIEYREGLDELAGYYRQVLGLLGENPEREGLQKTPMRVAKAMQFLTQGYTEDAHEVLRGALFKEDYSQMVIVKDIDFFSLCEHHMLPFYGKAHVAYIPNGYITGLSKIARVVDIFAHRLQVQERLTLQIKECIEQTLHPLGVMVVVEARHMCMQMRGKARAWAFPAFSPCTAVRSQPTRGRHSPGALGSAGPSVLSLVHCLPTKQEGLAPLPFTVQIITWASKTPVDH